VNRAVPLALTRSGQWRSESAWHCGTGQHSRGTCPCQRAAAASGRGGPTSHALASAACFFPPLPFAASCRVSLCAGACCHGDGECAARDPRPGRRPGRRRGPRLTYRRAWHGRARGPEAVHTAGSAARFLRGQVPLGAWVGLSAEFALHPAGLRYRRLPHWQFGFNGAAFASRRPKRQTRPWTVEGPTH
jgi:hypothetical protein